MIIDGHTLPCYFADGLCKPTTKTRYALVWFSVDFCLLFTTQDFVVRMTETEDRHWIETDFFVHSSIPNKLDTSHGVTGTHFPYVQVYICVCRAFPLIHQIMMHTLLMTIIILTVH